MRSILAGIGTLLFATTLAPTSAAGAGGPDPVEPVRRLVVTDPTGDVVGDAARKNTIDISEVSYAVRPSRGSSGPEALFEVGVAYQRVVPLTVGRQIVRTTLEAEGRVYVMVIRASLHSADLKVFRITAEGRKAVSMDSYGIGWSSPNGDLDGQVPAGIFKADQIDVASTVMRIVNDQGTARDTTDPTKVPVRLFL